MSAPHRRSGDVRDLARHRPPQQAVASLPLCRGIELFSGSAIMGDGNVVLILDLPSLVRRAERAFRDVEQDRGVRSKAREHAHHH